MTKFVMVKGDLKPSILATLQNSDGSVVDLTDCTVRFHMSQQGLSLVDKPTTIVTPSSGVVRYDWAQGDTNVTGLCEAEFQVTYVDATTQTFPTAEDFEIEFVDRVITTLPANVYITIDDIETQLNLAYDAASNNYTVYGLPLSPIALQANVNFANTYVASLLGSAINQADPKYPTAYMAALDVACIRILVVSMGGSLVGAFDYFLGDLRVARHGPYAEAIKQTLQGFREDLSRQLVNLTPVAVSFDVKSKGEVPTYRGGLVSP